MVAGLLLIEKHASVPPADESWKSHPALAIPDGRSHRGEPMLGADIKDPRVLVELSRRFRETDRFLLVKVGDEWIFRGAEHFEKRQEYLLRLLDHYLFSKQRLTGMTRAEIESIFGPLYWTSDRASVSAGRDTLTMSFVNDRVVDAIYSMGY